MKSTEVYRTLRTIVGPWFKARAYRRTEGGMLGWHRPRLVLAHLPAVEARAEVDLAPRNP